MPAVEVSNTAYFATAAAQMVPAAGQPFSAIARVRIPVGMAQDSYIIGAAGAGNDQWRLYVAGATGFPTWSWTVDGSAQTKTVATDIRDGLWHVIAGKSTVAATTWTPYASLDGAAFASGSTVAGDPGQNANVVTVGGAAGASVFQVGGAFVSNNYALTDADVAAYATPITGTPVPLMTYARTNTSCYEVGNHPVDGAEVKCFNANNVGYGFATGMDSLPGNEYRGLGMPVHAAVTNTAFYSEKLDSWSLQGTASVAADNVPAPDGQKTADTLTTGVDGNGVYRAGLSCTAAQPVSPQFYLKTSSVSGTVNFESAYSVAEGKWQIDLAALPVGKWVHITRSSSYVTVVAEFVCHGGNVWGPYFSVTSGTASFVVWGMQAENNNSYYPTFPLLYCPTPTNATATCNAVTSSYVAAANLTAWDRAQGVIAGVMYPTNTTAYAMDLHNGSDLNGAIRILSPTTEALIYDSSHVLKQDWSMTNAQSALTGFVMAYDDTTAFYSTTRRAYALTYQSSYAGPWGTYGTDSGAAWTPAAGTNLYIGQTNAGASQANGPVQTISVYRTR
jgi:hypothetical protein